MAAKQVSPLFWAVLVFSLFLSCGKSKRLSLAKPQSSQASASPLPPSVPNSGNVPPGSPPGAPPSVPPPPGSPPNPTLPFPPTCEVVRVSDSPRIEIDQAGQATGEGNPATYLVRASNLNAVLSLINPAEEFAVSQRVSAPGVTTYTGLFLSPGARTLRFQVTDPSTGLFGECSLATNVVPFGIATQEIFLYRGPAGSFNADDFYFTNLVGGGGITQAGFTFQREAFRTYVKPTAACDIPITQCQTCSGGHCLHFTGSTLACGGSEYLGSIGFGCATNFAPSSVNLGAVPLFNYHKPVYPFSYYVSIVPLDSGSGPGWIYGGVLTYVAPYP